MPNLDFIKKHRSWEDWLAMSLGAAIWATSKTAGGISEWIYWNTTLIGLTILILATMIYESHARNRELAEAACGAWLTVSPFVFGYAASGNLRFWHFGLGALVTLLALLELVQDWKDNEK